MKMVFICQAVDQDDPILASTIRWLEAMAGKPQVEEITVICLRKGRFLLPSNVSVHSIKGSNQFFTFARFCKEALRATIKGKTDCFFIYQGGPYPALLLPLKLLLGKQIYQWKAHPYISPAMHFYARFCDTKIFTSTPSAFPLNLPKVKVIGQGIDTEKFRPLQKEKTGDIVTVTRITPVKKLDKMFEALATCNDRYGTSCRLDLFGPVLEKDHEYIGFLEELVKKLGLKDLVIFRGPAVHEKLPDILGEYRVFLNLSETALDRAVVEAMACGLPVLSSNYCVWEILPNKHRNFLYLSDDIDAQAQRIHEVLSLGNCQLAEIGRNLRDVVVQDHGITSLIDKILSEIDADR